MILTFYFIMIDVKRIFVLSPCMLPLSINIGELRPIWWTSLFFFFFFSFVVLFFFTVWFRVLFVLYYFVVSIEMLIQSFGTIFFSFYLLISSCEYVYFCVSYWFTKFACFVNFFFLPSFRSSLVQVVFVFSNEWKSLDSLSFQLRMGFYRLSFSFHTNSNMLSISI